MAGRPSMGRKCPHQPEMTMAAAAAVGSRPRFMQVAMAMGAMTFTDREQSAASLSGEKASRIILPPIRASSTKATQ